MHRHSGLRVGYGPVFVYNLYIRKISIIFGYISDLAGFRYFKSKIFENQKITRRSERNTSNPKNTRVRIRSLIRRSKTIQNFIQIPKLYLWKSKVLSKTIPENRIWNLKKKYPWYQKYTRTPKDTLLNIY